MPSQQIYSFILTEDSIASYRPDLYAQREVVEPGGASYNVADAQSSQQSAGEGKTVYHKVQKGESLAGIAFYYGVSTDEIRSLNGFTGSKLRRGQVLKIVKHSDAGDDGSQLTAQASANGQLDGDATVSVVEQENKVAATNTPYKGSYRIDEVPAPKARQSQPKQQVPAAAAQQPKADTKATASAGKAKKVTDDVADASSRYGKDKARYGKTSAADAKKNRQSKESTYKNARSSKAKNKKQAAPQNYTIQKGDNLITIAKKTGVSVDELRKTNKIKGDKIAAGDNIKIPSTAKSKKAASAQKTKSKGKKKRK